MPFDPRRHFEIRRDNLAIGESLQKIDSDYFDES